MYIHSCFVGTVILCACQCPPVGVYRSQNRLFDKKNLAPELGLLILLIFNDERENSCKGQAGHSFLDKGSNFLPYPMDLME